MFVYSWTHTYDCIWYAASEGLRSNISCMLWVCTKCIYALNDLWRPLNFVKHVVDDRPTNTPTVHLHVCISSSSHYEIAYHTSGVLAVDGNRLMRWIRQDKRTHAMSDQPNNEWTLSIRSSRTTLRRIPADQRDGRIANHPAACPL